MENIVVARAAIRMAISGSREEEQRVKKNLLESGIRAAAVDFGGDFSTSLPKMVERAIVAAKRENVIKDWHPHQGAVAGATREALSQIVPRALGFSVGGKIGIAQAGEHLDVAVFLGVGLVHLDDVAIAVAHRAIPPE